MSISKKELRYKITGTFILALFCLNYAFAATYYIDAVSGKDSNSGLNGSPWQTIAKVNKASLVAGDLVLFARGQIFRGNLLPKSGTASANISYGAYGTGNKPLFLGSVNRKLTTDWVSAGTNLWKTSDVVTIGGNAVDAGNLILNKEASVGWKVSSLSLVTSQGRFYSDVSAKTVTMYSASNPGSFYSDIEIALCQNIINPSDKSYIIIENLDLRYSGAHGIGGSGTHHIIIRDVDISYIGGSYLSGTTRYGNGVEFYNDAHDNSVERCTFSQIYDAALTNQGDLANCQEYNIYYRNNIIRSSEYSFEIWLRGKGASLHDIYFENNTCLDAGSSWGHEQRVDPNASHLCFWGTSATFSNIVIRNNIFSNSAGAGIFEGKNNLADLKTSSVIINNNDWFVANMLAVMTGWDAGKPGPINTYYTWDYYLSLTQQDQNSITADPLLTPEYSIPSNSPCVNSGVSTTVATDFVGTTRPQGSEYDIGAFEYIGTSNLIVDKNLPELSLFPNPAKDSLTFQLSSIQKNENLQIYNTEGELVKEFIMTTVIQKISINNLPNGAYLVKIKSNPQLELKFIKQ
jgi:hypothetical protein